MAWQKYVLVFRLQSPLHIGYRKTGNLMQTRGYVPGKILWAALTARLTRDYDNGADGQRYVDIGEDVNKSFRFGYLYPALPKDPLKEVRSVSDLAVRYPWDDDFDYLFLNSYASTALDYTSQSAEEAMLHETEFIAPHTRTGQPVYLTGDLFVQTDLQHPLNQWRDALHKLQLGAERGYGWGRLRLVPCNKQGAPFTNEPRVDARNGRITAHLKVDKVSNIQGAIEPLIGWERNNDSNRTNNWKLSEQALICYAPGAEVAGEHNFRIGPNGLWEIMSG